MTPAVEELIQELNKNGGQTTVSAAMNLKIGASGSSLGFRKRLYALERHGYIVLKGNIIEIHPDYKAEPTLVERLADHLLLAFDQLKRITLEAITIHLKKLSNEFRVAGARRKKMLADAINELQRRGLQLKEELEGSLTYFQLVRST